MKALLHKIYDLCCASMSALIMFLVIILMLIIFAISIGATLFAIILFIFCVPIYALFVRFAESD